jgi:hypothetical protein
MKRNSVGLREVHCAVGPAEPSGRIRQVELWPDAVSQAEQTSSSRSGYDRMVEQAAMYEEGS